MIPAQYAEFLKLNPAYYFIEGYRQSFIYHEWFWENLGAAAYFWAVTLAVMFVGATCFKKLRPHFADVL